MGLYRCSSEGGMTKTLLWSNANPTSSFSESTVELSQSWRNFTHIQIKCAIEYLGTLYPREIILSKDSMGTFDSGYKPAMATNSNGVYCRYYGFTDDTHIKISNATQLYGTGINNSLLIPYRIYGLNISN